MNYSFDLQFSNDDKYVWGDALIDSVICSKDSHTFPKFMYLRYCYNDGPWIYYDDMPSCQLERPFRLMVPSRTDLIFMEFEVSYDRKSWFERRKSMIIIILLFFLSIINSICLLYTC